MSNLIRNHQTVFQQDCRTSPLARLPAGPAAGCPRRPSTQPAVWGHATARCGLSLLLPTAGGVRARWPRTCHPATGLSGLLSSVWLWVVSSLSCGSSWRTRAQILRRYSPWGVLGPGPFPSSFTVSSASGRLGSYRSPVGPFCPVWLMLSTPAPLLQAAAPWAQPSYPISTPRLALASASAVQKGSSSCFLPQITTQALGRKASERSRNSPAERPRREPGQAPVLHPKRKGS